MTVDPESNNTLILAVMEIDSKALAVGNLRVNGETIAESIIETASSALEATKKALNEAILIKPRQILILSNCSTLVRLYTHPIRLPLYPPKNLEDYYNPRGGQYRKGEWQVPDSVSVTKDGEVEWDVMRLLCCFDKWQFKYLHEDNMKRTKEMWRDHYDSRTN